VIVYVETNFLLELAYLQEDCKSCAELLELGAQNAVWLLVPAFSLIEARLAWDRRSSERNALQNQLQPIIRQLARSEPFKTLTESSRELISALVASGEEARARLEEAISGISSVGTILPLTTEISSQAHQAELRLSLAPSDAVVYATVMAHLKTAPTGAKCFFNRDSKDFANPNVSDELAAFGCKLFVTFTKGMEFVRSELRSAS
jgi:predicted nucleic acid-binding protein